MATTASNVPSRKWLATQVTAFAALLTAYVTAGSWNQTLSISLIGLVAQAIIAYLLPNADTSASGGSDRAGSSWHRATPVPSRDIRGRSAGHLWPLVGTFVAARRRRGRG